MPQPNKWSILSTLLTTCDLDVLADNLDADRDRVEELVSEMGAQFAFATYELSQREDLALKSLVDFHTGSFGPDDSPVDWEAYSSLCRKLGIIQD